ncbi:hypothetical protein V1511DRAFT_511300 [Dipodascopsis uninucleata]
MQKVTRRALSIKNIYDLVHKSSKANVQSEDDDLYSFSSDGEETLKLNSPRLSRRSGIPEDFYMSAEKSSREGWKTLRSFKGSIKRRKSHSSSSVYGSDSSSIYHDTIVDDRRLPIEREKLIEESARTLSRKPSKWGTIRRKMTIRKNKDKPDIREACSNKLKHDQKNIDVIPLPAKVQESIQYPCEVNDHTENLSLTGYPTDAIINEEISPYISASISLATFKSRQETISARRLSSHFNAKPNVTIIPTPVYSPAKKPSNRFGYWETSSIDGDNMRKKVPSLSPFMYQLEDPRLSRVKWYLDAYRRSSRLDAYNVKFYA